MPAGLVMMVISPLAGRLERTIGPRALLTGGAIALVVAYTFVYFFSDEVWHILLANILVGIGIGLGFAGMPMLIMRAVPANETGASNGLNALFRSVGTSAAAAVLGAVLAAMSQSYGGIPVPTAAAFQACFLLAGGAAVVALALSLLIPRHGPPVDHASIPDGR
jgi:MFS family permease